jgi:hypothetical protein
MKKIATIIGLCVFISGHALAQTNQIVMTTNAAPIKIDMRLPDKIIASSGHVFDGPKLQSVSDNRIGITYFDEEDVMKSSSIELADLPPDLQKQFHYDPKKAAIADAKDAALEKKFSHPSGGMTRSELNAYYYNSTIDRRIDELNAEIAAEKAAELAREEDRKERLVEAKEKEAAAAQQAADAATTQAINPPVQQTIIINHPY